MIYITICASDELLKLIQVLSDYKMKEKASDDKFILTVPDVRS